MREMISIFLTLLVISACGSDATKSRSGKSGPDEWETIIKPIVQTNCLQCHANFGTEAGFRRSQAKTYLEQNKMPPAPRTIATEDKVRLLGFLRGPSI